MWPFKSKNWAKLGVQYPKDRVKGILINATGCHDIRLNDSVYRAIPYKDFIKLAWEGNNDNFRYDPETNDCDDFSIYFEADTRKMWANKASGCGAALAFGRAVVVMKEGSSVHMVIWQVDDKGFINWIEPQTFEKIEAPYAIYFIEG